MKKMVFVFPIALIILSCSKNKEVNKGLYLGKWELTKTISNGFAVDTLYSKNNGNTITLNNDNNFITTILNRDTAYTTNDIYKFENGNACGETSAVPILILQKGGAYVAIVQDTLLSLSTKECADYSHTDYYRKIN